ncbi:DUF11 domain-containing protein [Leucothrix pacifica]|uniref:Uncharacterized protein n=1 Tax=Leucothrix pacifica TaxID=1247513 RepID=A0A317CN34_9GAMM|nr:DUF11 domain-containing protein [Leucothrix pacifica]PWQ99958.1 hypothetical protein DKW60_03905 [Leucothrix pacifica]
MKTKNQMKPLARLIATSLAVGTMAGFGAQVYAQTAAGTLIKNLATVTYEDENGNEYSAQSNEAVVTVAPVFSATIENDNSLSAAPGQTVYFPHTLSNTGNVADTYTVTADAGDVYYDQNNNGQPDPGEPLVTGPIAVPAGEQANFVVALPIPTDAADGSVHTSELTAVSTGGATVVDVGDNSDSTDGTVDNVATVSTGPVLVLNKSSVHDEVNNQITYTLTVKNNGGTEATNVNIIDALPSVDTDDNGTADTQVTLVPSSIAVSGLVNAGDIVPTSTVIGAESDLGDLNFDGDVTDSLNVIVAKDVTLPANTTVTVVYTIEYQPTWAAGVDIDNTFIAFDDINDDGTPDDSTTGVVPSNTTHDEIPQTYGVIADNTGINPGAGVNDGGDDDSDGGNDSQYVDIAATGAEVEFNHVITNDSNGEDSYNINVQNDVVDGFPAGTVFTYWDATGSVQLTDTNDDGIPDTGLLGAGADTTIKVKAKLPAGVSGTQPTGYNATLTATSTSDPSASPEDDTTALKLGEITPPNVDIANVMTGGQGDDLANGFNDSDGQNAQDEAPALLVDGATNSVVTFNLKLANESGSADSYTLGANNIPDGWDVVFKDSAGNVITTTSLVPGGEVFEYQAVVTISADPAESMSDADQVGAVDGYDAVNDGSVALVDGDGDKDYQINFTATSTSTPSISDSLTNAIDIAPDRDVVITPNGQNQIQPGGTVDYSHKLENNGNQTEVLELGSDNTQSGWTTIINVDTDNDGVPDTILTSALAGTTITGVDEDGNYVDIEVTDTDGDGIPELNLEPGENVDMTTTVTSPSNAPLGSVDASTITVADAADPLNPEITSAQDQTTVILGQVRLDKTAAIDVDCDGDPETGFLATQTQQVEPGQCVTWRLTATNEGSATVQNVVISDAAPEFTDIVSGKLKFCHGNGCVPSAVTDAKDAGDQGTYDAGLVKFFAGNADDVVQANPVAGTGGELIAGEQATGEFTVKVQ